MPETFNSDHNLGDAQAPVSATPRLATQVATPLRSSGRLRPGLGVWLRDLIISLAISAFIIVFIYQPVKVEGTSMMPSLEDQERIFVNKFVYRLEAIEHGDIVVFRYPRDPSKSYIKRVIGVAGDRIRIDGGQVYVNDESLDEDYVPPAYTDARSYPETVVPANCYFVLGDHRSMSNDSRDFGPVNVQRWWNAGIEATSTARPCSATGRWIKWAGCGEQLERNLADRSTCSAAITTLVPENR